MGPRRHATVPARRAGSQHHHQAPDRSFAWLHDGVHQHSGKLQGWRHAPRQLQPQRAADRSLELPRVRQREQDRFGRYRHQPRTYRQPEPYRGRTRRGTQSRSQRDAVVAGDPDQVVDFEAGFSRQGNIYAGDTQNNNGTANTQGLADDGAETNRMYRENYAITHNGTWSFGTSRFVAQYDSTRNNRLEEGLAGSVEGQIGADRSFSTSKLENYRLSGELNLPLHALFEQVLTVGAEWNKETLNDPSSLKQGFVGSDSLPGTPRPALEARKARRRSGRCTWRTISNCAPAPCSPRAAPGRSQRLRPELEPEPERFPDARRILHGQGRYRTGLQGAQPVPEQPELPALYPWQRLPDPDQQRRLLPGRQREPGRRDQRQQGTGHRVPARWLGRRAHLLPQRLQEQDRRAAGCHGTDRDR